MVANKYKIVKTVTNGEKYYHAEKKYWFWPFWVKITGYKQNKDQVKFLINNKDELEKDKKGKA